MSTPNDFFNGPQFIPAKLADHLTGNIAGYHLITPRTDEGGDVTWRYHEDLGIFKPGGAGYIKKLADEALGNKSSPGRVNAALFVAQIRTYMDQDQFVEEPGIIVLKNGVYHIDTCELTKHSPLHFAKSALPVKYDSDAKCPVFLKFLERVAPTYMELLQEWTGYHFLKEQRFQRFVILVGDGDNGKSTYLHVLTHLLGPKNVSHETLYQISTDRFSIERLHGKLANIAADIGPTELKLTGALKIATGEDIGSAQKKFKDKFDFMSYAKLTFSCNQVPKTPDETKAFHKRHFVLLFNITIPLAEQDKTLKKKLIAPEELSGILNWALEGLHRLLERGQFNEPTTIEERQIQYRRLSNPILAFIEDCVIEDIETQETKDMVYMAVVKYCKNNGFVIPSDGVFFKEFKKHVYYHNTRITVDGQRIQVLKGLRLTDAARGVTPDKGDIPKERIGKSSIDINTSDIPATLDSFPSETEKDDPPHEKERIFTDAIKVLDTPKKIQEQMSEIFKIIFDHQEPIKDIKIGEKLGTPFSELRKLLGVLEKDGLIEQTRPSYWIAVSTASIMTEAETEKDEMGEGSE